MIENPVTEESLHQALRRITDFSLVHSGTIDPVEKLEALTILRASLGLTDDMLVDLDNWVDSITGDAGYTPAVLLGLIVGLIAADHEFESQ